MSTWTSIIDWTPTGTSCVGPPGNTGGETIITASATATGGSTTTIISASLMYAGNKITFAANTTTVGLRNVTAYVVSVSGTGPYTATVATMAAACANTDTFQISQLYGTGTAAATGTDNLWADFHGNDVLLAGVNGLEIYSDNNTQPASRNVLARYVNSEAAQDQRIVVTTPVPYPNAGALFANTPICVCRYQPARGTGYAAWFNDQKKLVIGTFTGTSVTALYTSAAQTITATTKSYRLDFSVTGVNPTTLNATLFNVTDSTTVIVGTTQTDSTSELQGPGYFAFSASNNTPGFQCYSSRIQTFSDTTTQVLAGSLTIGIPFQTAASATSVSFMCPPATGGVAPYTYQWYRSLTSGFTPGAGNILAGQTALTLTDTFPDSQSYYYKLIATDSTGGTPLTVTSQQVCASQRSATGALTGAILMIGDSLTVGNGQVNSNPQAGAAQSSVMLAATIKNVYGLRDVNVLVRGVGGQTSANWAVGGALFTDALNAAANSTLTPWAHISLGTNDSKTAVRTTKANYKSNIIGIVNALTAQGIKVCLSAPPYINAALASALWDENSNDLIKQYTAALDEIIAADVTGLVFTGDRTLFKMFSNYPYLLGGDGVHPTTVGFYEMGASWSVRVAAMIGANPATIIKISNDFTGGI